MRVLAGGVQRVIAGAAGKVTYRHTRLHRVGHQTVVAQLQRGHVCGFLERLFDGSLVLLDKAPVIAKVVLQIVMHLGCIGLQRILHVDHRRQFGDVHINGFGRITRLRQCLGHDGGDWFAHVADLAGGQNRVARFLHDFTVFVGDLPAAGHPAHAGKIRGGKDFYNTRHPLSRRSVDIVDRSVRDIRAQEKHIGLSAQVDIVGVISRTRQKPDVLTPFRAGADASVFWHI